MLHFSSPCLQLHGTESVLRALPRHSHRNFILGTAQFHWTNNAPSIFYSQQMCADVECLSTLRRGLFSSCFLPTLSFLPEPLGGGQSPRCHSCFQVSQRHQPYLLAFHRSVSTLSLTGPQSGVEYTVMGIKDVLSSFKVQLPHKHTHTIYTESLTQTSENPSLTLEEYLKSGEHLKENSVI